jgi:prepilin-type N-terminal cleavage/methylation domain-containing protein
MKKNRSTRKGFTLIELLVVITIIGILAGIAFVGFGDVFGTAGRTAAQKNLKTVYESLAAKTRNFPTSDEVSSAGVPANIPADGSEFTAAQKEALGYAVAIPRSGEAKSRSFVTNLESGPFPIMWTAGLEGERWGDNSAWAGEGGHVLFSDGTVRWFEETKQNDVGVFTKAVDKGEDVPESFESTESIRDAVPASWEIYNARK